MHWVKTTVGWFFAFMKTPLVLVLKNEIEQFQL
jgi:hypothetical protein